MNTPPADEGSQGSDDALGRLESEITRLNARLESLTHSIHSVEAEWGSHARPAMSRWSAPPPQLQPRPAAPPAPAPYARQYAAVASPSAPRPTPEAESAPQQPAVASPPADPPAASGQRTAAAPARERAAASAAVPAKWLLGERYMAALREERHVEPEAVQPSQPGTVTVCFEPVADISATARLQQQLNGMAEIEGSTVKRVGHGRATLEISTPDRAELARALADRALAESFSGRGRIWHVDLAPGRP